MDLSVTEENCPMILEKLQEAEVAVNKQLNHILSRHYHVEAKLQNISKVLPNVVVVCQSRVNNILDLQLYSQGVGTALRNENYEQGTAHVLRYLSMDQKLLERTAEDVSGDRTSVASSLSTLQQAVLELRTVVTHKFDEAVKCEDLASVERFFKLFPLLGMHTWI